MSRTANLRRQHDRAAALVAEIQTLADGSGAVEPRAAEIATLLARLTGLLRIHFAQEDQTLYPRLVMARDPLVAATAAAFQREMGGIGPAVAAFTERWLRPAHLAADMEGFRRDAAQLFGALAQRIRRENDELYPLADTLVDYEVPAGSAAVDAPARAVA